MRNKRLGINSNNDNGSSSAPRITIDHRFFPHIIDLVFSSLSYRGLISWSKACTEWRERVRPLLLNHVAICEDENRRLAIVRSHEPGDLPQVTEAEIVDIYYKESKPDAALGSTTVDPLRPPAFHRLLSPHYTKHNATPRSRTDFLSYNLGWTDVVHFIDYLQGSFVLATDCPRSPTVLTLSIDCYTNPASYVEYITSPYSYAFDDLYGASFEAQYYTNIFKNCTGQEAPANSASLTAARDQLSVVQCRDRTLGAACELLLFIGDRDSHIERIAVVGMDDFVAADNLHSYLHSICWRAGELKGRSCWPNMTADVPCLGEYLKFYTHDQYRKMVGEERYRLLTVR